MLVRVTHLYQVYYSVIMPPHEGSGVKNPRAVRKGVVLLRVSEPYPGEIKARRHAVIRKRGKCGSQPDDDFDRVYHRAIYARYPFPHTYYGRSTAGAHPSGRSQFPARDTMYPINRPTTRQPRPSTDLPILAAPVA